MSKSNLIILGVLALSSVVFLCLWYFLGLHIADRPFDFVLTIIWWLLVAGACVAIHVVEKKRCETIRTAFLAPGVIFNSEVGMVPVTEAKGYLGTLQSMLSGLDYTFERAEVPQESRTKFNYIVRTMSFSKNGERWTGEFVRVSRPDNPVPFQSRAELGALLSEL